MIVTALLLMLNSAALQCEEVAELCSNFKSTGTVLHIFVLKRYIPGVLRKRCSEQEMCSQCHRTASAVLVIVAG